MLWDENGVPGMGTSLGMDRGWSIPWDGIGVPWDEIGVP